MLTTEILSRAASYISRPRAALAGPVLAADKAVPRDRKFASLATKPGHS